MGDLLISMPQKNNFFVEILSELDMLNKKAEKGFRVTAARMYF
jgi:hypothetical protein